MGLETGEWNEMFPLFHWGVDRALGGLGGFLKSKHTQKGKKKWWGELVVHTLFYKSSAMLHFEYIYTLELNCWALSQYLKTPYWSTARVCCWPPQWERRMKGWLPEYALCALCSGWIWINTVHLSYTPSSFPLLTDYLIGSLLPLSIIARICHQLIAIFFSLKLWRGSLIGWGDRRVEVPRGQIPRCKI